MNPLRGSALWPQFGAVSLLLLAAGPGAAQTPPAPQTVSRSVGTTTGGPIAPPPNTQEQKSLLVQMQDAFTNIAQTVEPTVVNIKAERLTSSSGDDSDGGGAPGGPSRKGAPFSGPGMPRLPRRSQATGSGVIVRADGYILTNDHVIDQAVGGQVTVRLSDGREFIGKVYPDFKSDLAIVKIDPGAAPLPVATFADTASVRPGQWALAVGSPFDLQNTITVGIISAVDRHQTISGDEGEGRYYPDLIQTDAAINPGNSGGPLFNIDGKVVGINVAIESPVEGSAGVGFAIPMVIAQQVANALIERGKVTRGYLGLAPDDLTPAFQEKYGLKQGAFIKDVVLDSPAGKAGLQAGDIVTSFGGKPIRDEITLRTAIAAAAPGQAVQIAYVRDGTPGQTTATIAAPLAAAGDAPATPVVPVATRYKLGLSIRDLTARDRQQLSLPADAAGVFVASVATGSAAEAADVSSGMVIQKINATTVRAKGEFDRAVTGLSDPDVTLVVLYTDPTDNQLHQRALTFRL